MLELVKLVVLEILVVLELVEMVELELVVLVFDIFSFKSLILMYLSLKFAHRLFFPGCMAAVVFLMSHLRFSLKKRHFLQITLGIVFFSLVSKQNLYFFENKPQNPVSCIAEKQNPILEI